MARKSAIIDSNDSEFWKKKYEELLTSKNDNDSSDEDIYISPDKNIRVMSLCNHTLNLTTGSGKDAKKRVFEHFGQTKSIPYSVLVEMIEHQPTFAENGVYYILDKDVIRKSGLSEYYDKILKKEDIEKILKNSENSLSLYKTLNTKQREMVNEMLVQKVRDGEITDLNLISAIEREGNVDIMERVKYSKEFLKEHPELEPA